MLEYQPDCSSTVVRQMNFRHRDPATALTTKHTLVLNQTFGDISLAHRHTHHTSPMSRRNDVNCTGRRNICNNNARLLPQTNLSSNRERHLLGERLAQLADNSQALAIGVVGEADGSAASLHYRAKLGHRLGLRLGC